MEVLGPLVEILRGGSPWLLLVATWIGGAGVLIRALVSGRLYTRGQYLDAIAQRDQWIERCERWERIGMAAANVAETLSDKVRRPAGGAQ